ncbi:MAG TPA: HIT family protein [Gemmatimonadaceae bacterium]|nr:HIT family protein [Gemmatimonadaceae bacterium]
MHLLSDRKRRAPRARRVSRSGCDRVPRSSSAPPWARARDAAQHVETLDDLPDGLLAPVFGAVRRTSIAVQKALRAEGSFVATNTRVSQSVPHLHVHVVPRNKGDGLFSTRLVWQRKKYETDAEMAEIATKIRTAFELA